MVGMSFASRFVRRKAPRQRHLVDATGSRMRSPSRGRLYSTPSDHAKSFGHNRFELKNVGNIIRKALLRTSVQKTDGRGIARRKYRGFCQAI